MTRVSGIHQIQICDPSVTRSDVERFVAVWRRARALLISRGFGRVASCVDVALTGNRSYYARYWQNGTLCVNVRAFLRERDPVGTLVHEMGHRVWFKAMRKKTRMAWVADHYRLKRATRGNFPSSYAKEEPIEDHAENFRLHVQQRLKGPARARYERLGPSTRTIQERLRRRAA